MGRFRPRPSWPAAGSGDSGARPLRRAVQHEIEDRLSERILQGELNAGDHVHVDYVDGQFTFVTTQREGISVAAGIGTGTGTPDLAITSE